MWPGVQNVIYNLLWEIALRIVLIAVVCIFQLKLQPRMGYITEYELLNTSHYKRPRHDSYVPPWAIVSIVVFVPLLFFYIVFLTTKNYMDAIQAMLAWTLALTVTALITESLKLMVGRPRPDFFYRCFPNGNMTSDLICTGNLREVIEGRKSFPSGHSSFAFCSLGFLSIWMSGNLKVFSEQRVQKYKVVVILVPLVIAGAVALSRHCDNHHHWEDILVGSMLGLASSYLCYCQYYNPLNSDYAGEPLTTITEDELFYSFELECCTRSLSDDLSFILHLSNKNSLENNIKIN